MVDVGVLIVKVGVLPFRQHDAESIIVIAKRLPFMTGVKGPTIGALVGLKGAMHP